MKKTFLDGSPDDYVVRVEHPYAGKVAERGNPGGFIEHLGDLYDPRSLNITIERKDL